MTNNVLLWSSNKIEYPFKENILIINVFPLCYSIHLVFTAVKTVFTYKGIQSIWRINKGNSKSNIKLFVTRFGPYFNDGFSLVFSCCLLRFGPRNNGWCNIWFQETTRVSILGLIRQWLVKNI